jgi:hypothetical protein
MTALFVACLGWSATAVFVGSYFFVRPSLLRGAQMCGALLWIIYGLLINATPVVVANILVFAAAAFTASRRTIADERVHPFTLERCCEPVLAEVERVTHNRAPRDSKDR